VVEPAQTGKSGRKCNITDGKRGFGQELFSEQNTLRAGHGDGRSAEVLVEQAPKLAIADAETRGEIFNRALVEGAVRDQA
jgi:hypothetical protein